MKSTFILILTALSVAGLSSCAAPARHHSVYSHTQLPKQQLEVRNHSNGGGALFHNDAVSMHQMPIHAGGKLVAGQ